MTLARVTIGVACGLMGAILCPDLTASVSTSPTFNKDVAPIIYSKCVTCHRPRQVAPMVLQSYEDTRPWAQAIKRKVLSREMPPWYADPRFGTFENNPSLTEQEIATIAAWVDGGAPQGSGQPPTPPRFAEGWNHPSGRAPDVVLEMPIEFPVPAEGTFPTFNVYSRLPPELLKPGRFVEAVQILPGDPSVVHHSQLSMRNLPVGVTIGTGPAWPGGPTLSNVPVAIDPRAREGIRARGLSAAEAFSMLGASHLVYYFPGNNGFTRFPVGAGKRPRPADYLEWSVHYNPSGRPARDRERAAVWLHPAPPTHEVVTLRVGDFHVVNGEETSLPADAETNPGGAAFARIKGSCGGNPCVLIKSVVPEIPPHAQNWRITAITPFQDDVTLYQGFPHGHFRLKAMTYVVTYPDGREQPILSVPRYDFNWQLVYRWTEPLRIPAGSTIKAIGYYDNSTANKRNPAPEKTVYWGEQSWQEMFNGFIDLSIDKLDLRLETQGGETQSAGSTPKVPLVLAAGCAIRDRQGEWRLIRASEPQISNVAHADARELAEARAIRSGVAQYRLVGTAEFASIDELLARPDRTQFTDRATANATGQLVDGYKIAVKGLLTTESGERRLNLLSVQAIANTCS